MKMQIGNSILDKYKAGRKWGIKSVIYMFLIKEICINEQQELSLWHVNDGGRGIKYNADTW